MLTPCPCTVLAFPFAQGFCYVNYSTPEAAAAAIEQYNGMEFPPHSGHRIKVLYAEPLGVRPPAVGTAVGGAGSAAVVGPPAPPAPPGSVGSAGGACATSPAAMATPPSVAHAPLSRNISPDIVSMTDSLGSMAMPSASLEPVDRTVLLASPVSSTGRHRLWAHLCRVQDRRGWKEGRIAKRIQPG